MNSWQVLVLLPLLVGADSSVQTSWRDLENSSISPIQKVVKLVTEMKAQTIKEGEEDLEAYDAYKCWCANSESEKTAAVKAAETKIQELTSFVEEAAAKEGQLKTEISGLTDDIASDEDSLASATSMRADENKDFTAEEADMKETLGLLSEAIAILSKVQLLQKQHKSKDAEHALLQVHELVKHMSPKFNNVMQKDLYDLLGEFQGVGRPQRKDIAMGSFLGEVFLPKKDATALSQAGSLPWVKSEEQIGAESNPNDQKGAGAGAKSHNSASGGILGLLKAQGDEFARKLAESQKRETQSLQDFQSLKAAKTAEIAAATTQKDNKGLELANLMDKAAKAKEDIEATMGALSADQAFLVDMTKNCASEDEEYTKRNNVRTEEIKALGETLNILTGDEARDLFGKTISFVQVGSVSHIASAQAAAQERARTDAMQKIMTVSRKHKNWMLATLAVHVKLDAFTKVKAAMDKMLVELAEQQKSEVVKHDSCKTQIDETEDKIWTGKNEKNDLAEKHKDESNTIEVLTGDIALLQSEVAEAEVSLKQAGEQRKAENKLFQSSIADQRATIQILTMALDRLKEFYAPKGAAMAQIKLHSSVAPPPPKPAGYEKSGSSGGVLQLLNMIIADAGRTEDELKMSEQKAQEEYGSYVAATTASIEADREAIAEKEKQAAGTRGENAETSEAQLANGASLDKLDELLRGIHGECDFLLKYFDVRQTARAEEIDSINEAKAILSGADFA